MEALVDIFPVVLFVLFVLAGRVMRALQARTAAAQEGDAPDDNTILEALGLSPPPLPQGPLPANPPAVGGAVPPPAVRQVRPLASSAFRGEQADFREGRFAPGRFYDEGASASSPVSAAGAPRPGPSKPPNSYAQRLRSPGALREAFVMQTLLQRRRR